MATPAKEVAKELRILQSDVVSMLEGLGQPTTIFGGVVARFDRIVAHPETLEEAVFLERQSVEDLVRKASHYDQLAGRKRRHRRKHRRNYSETDF